MKKFNQTISVEVEVDAIAQNLLNQFGVDYKHKELVAEAIIGTMLHTGGLGALHNALSGYKNELDFQVGDVLVIKGENWNHMNNWEVIGNSSRDWIIGKITEIEEYKIGDKLKVDWIKVDFSRRTDGNIYTVHVLDSWVDHRNCTKLADLTWEEALDKIQVIVNNTNAAAQEPKVTE